MFGDDLLIWLVLALAAAMVVGNMLALARPPAEQHSEGDLDRAPKVRSFLFIVIGLLATIWALASLISG